MKDDHEIRIRALEDKLNPPPLVATTLWDKEVEGRIAALEASVAKQRTLNAELWAWFQDDSSEPISESLAVAFEDALK